MVVYRRRLDMCRFHFIPDEPFIIGNSLVEHDPLTGHRITYLRGMVHRI